MVFGVVDQDAVAAVVGDWTGIPIGRMVKDEIQSVLTIADEAQEPASSARITRWTRSPSASRPAGPSSTIPTSRSACSCSAGPVGRRQDRDRARALSELLFSGDDSMIVINMSEFQEAHTVSTLKGAPAGYVGYGQGGVLTEAVRRRPYSVVLLDEVEKAHPDVHEMFFQVFDKGFMNDSRGAVHRLQELR